MANLTVCVITLNEEEILPLCLASATWADEILVVDSHSTDGTREIARKFGARVLEHDFAGFAAQLNWAFEQTTTDWIMVVDADEVVDQELRAAVEEVMASPAPEFEVYDVVRDAYFLGRRMRSSSWSNERLPRLFRRGAMVYKGLVHQVPDYGDRPVGVLRGRLIHYSDRTVEQYFQKFQRYTTLWARDQFAKGRTVGLPRAVLVSQWRFFHNYLFRGEIRDGAHGFLSSVLAMAYTFIKYVKLWGLVRESRADAATTKTRNGEGE